MIYSMTGFGAAECKIANTVYKIEIRSLNSKGLDLNLKLPNHLKFLEGGLRPALNEIIRGKVDISINEEKANTTPEVGVELNLSLMHHYHRQLQQFVHESGVNDNDMLRAIMSLPNVINEVKNDVDQESILQSVQTSLAEAVAHLQQFRKLEGANLRVDLEQKLLQIEQYLLQVETHESDRLTRIRERITRELKNLSQEVDIDPGRLEMEMIFYMEKLDINEEKVRLSSHIQYFRDILAENTTIEKGKKLGFLSQEMGREINTIGSKANHSEIQKFVVLMKDDLEKIKEQVNNVL